VVDTGIGRASGLSSRLECEFRTPVGAAKKRSAHEQFPNNTQLAMFSGFQEILLIAVIVVAIVVAPRLLQRRPQPAPAPSRRKTLALPIRLAVVVSLIWLLAAGAWFRPWTGELSDFIIFGVLPVAAVWAVLWIRAGRHNPGG
jgi:hypothetical protein